MMVRRHTGSGVNFPMVDSWRQVVGDEGDINNRGDVVAMVDRFKGRVGAHIAYFEAMSGDQAIDLGPSLIFYFGSPCGVLTIGVHSDGDIGPAVILEETTDGDQGGGSIDCRFYIGGD